MSTPAEQNFDVWRGNNWDRQFRCKDEDGNLVDLTGSQFIFRVMKGNTELIREVMTLPDDLTTGLIGVGLIPDQTRLLKRDEDSNYEVERRFEGTEITIFYGVLTGKGGDNDDV